MHDDKKICPDCGEGVSRRGFMKTAAGAAAAAALTKAPVWASTWREEKPEAIAKRFYESLKPEQKELVALPWEDPRRLKVSNNWDIVPQQIGKFYSGEQQQMIKDIFRGVVSEDGAGRFAKQMKDDYGGFERYTVATFGDPSTAKFEWVLTGRHLTMRCNSDKDVGAAFGRPRTAPRVNRRRRRWTLVRSFRGPVEGGPATWPGQGLIRLRRFVRRRVHVRIGQRPVGGAGGRLGS